MKTKFFNPIYLRRFFSLLFLLLLIYFCNIDFISAKDLNLYGDNQQIPDEDYKKLIAKDNVKNGDRIFVSKDRYFIVKRHLGEGNTTRVFEVIDPKREREPMR